MKKILSTLAFVFVGFLSIQAQGPTMIFEATTVNYGTIDVGSEPIRRFKFTNTGNEPLIIKSAQGSCGCVVPTYPQEPIMPGKSSYIIVRYDTKRVGMFTKTVTLTTNELDSTHTLLIKGEVKAPTVQETVPTSIGKLRPD